MTVLYLSEHRAIRGLPEPTERNHEPFDEQQMARMQVRRRLYDFACNETTVALAELHAVRLIRDEGKLIHDAVRLAVNHALARHRPKTDPPPQNAA